MGILDDLAPKQAEPTHEFAVSGESASLHCQTHEQPRNDRDIIRLAQVDELCWRVKKWKATCGEVAMKMRDPDRVHTQQVWWVTAEFERVMSDGWREGLDLLLASINDNRPATPKPPRVQSGQLYVPCLYDVHFGKYAWPDETGGDAYDLKIAETEWQRAAVGLLKEVAHKRISRIMMPVGQDLIHIDTVSGTTTGGTPQDVDGRIPKVVRTAYHAVRWAIDEFLKVAPVDVVVMPGNHDELVTYILGIYLSGVYEGNKHVTIDERPLPRKYYRYENNLIGITHGHKRGSKGTLSSQRLAELMPIEASADWGRTTYREILKGHLHHERKFDRDAAGTHAGVVVRDVPALCATDAYHSGAGYVGQPRAAQGFLYRREGGLTNVAYSYARG